jgi:glutamyl-tRNA reductase
MKLVSSSITHHNCPVAVRERLSFTQKQRQVMLRKMHAQDSISEAVILQTCNRIEFYVYARKNLDCEGFLAELVEQLQPGAAEIWGKHSRNKAGLDVVRHLFEVAAGLDSQMVGENQILSQVKNAYTESVDCRMSKFVFHKLFHNAFRVGKVVRADTNISCGAVSVGLAAVELAKRQNDIRQSTAMVIGAGENAELVARYLLKAGLRHLIVANRSRQKAKSLSLRLKAGEAIGLADVAGRLAEVDLVISSTAAARPILTYQTVKDSLAGREKKLLMIDIAVPRDIEPKVGRVKCVRLVNIDDLNEQINCNRSKRRGEMTKARHIVAEFTDKFAAWHESLNSVPVISELMQKSLRLARSEAKRYAKDFGDGNGDKLKLFAESLTKKILHGPISFVKAGVDEELSTEQLQGVDLINKMFFSRGRIDQ